MFSLTAESEPLPQREYVPLQAIRFDATRLAPPDCVKVPVPL